MQRNAGGTEGKEAFFVLAEVVDHFLGVESAGFGNID